MKKLKTMGIIIIIIIIRRKFVKCEWGFKSSSSSLSLMETVKILSLSLLNFILWVKRCRFYRENKLLYPQFYPPTFYRVTIVCFFFSSCVLHGKVRERLRQLESLVRQRQLRWTNIRNLLPISRLKKDVIRKRVAILEW